MKTNILKQNTTIKDLLILCLILLPYFLIFLGNHGLLETDEGRYNEVAWGMFKNKEYIIPKINGVIFFDKPILFYWLQVISFKIFGFSEFSARFFPAITGVLSCLGLYIFGKKTYSRKTGLIAALILSTMLYWFCLSHYSNMDIEVASWLSLSLLSFITGINKYNKKLVLLSYIFAALAFLTKGLIAVAFPVIIIALWVIIDKKWHLIKHMKIISGIIVFLIISSPWFIAVQIKHPEFLHYFFIDQEVDRFISTKMNEQQQWWFYIYIIIAGTLPWMFFIIQSFLAPFGKLINLSEQEKSTAKFLVIWSIFILLFFSIPASKPAGYIAPAFPPIALLIALFLSNIKKQTWKSKSFKISNYILIFYLFITAIAFVTVCIFNLSQKNEIIYPNLIIQAIIMIISGVLFIYAYKNKKINYMISVLIISSIFCNLNILNTIPKFPINSVKLFAENLNIYIKTNTIVASYNTYPRGLPLYLNKQIIVVNDWFGPNTASDGYKQIFEFGLRNNPKSYPWLMTPNKFIKKWSNNNNNIITIISIDSFNESFKYFKSKNKNSCIITKNKMLAAIKNNC